MQKKVLSPEIVERARPVNLRPEDISLFANDLKKELPEVTVHSLPDVNVTPAGIIFRGLHLYSDFLVWPAHRSEFNISYLLRNFLKRKKVKGNPSINYIICFDYWSRGYFHWICDFLPRLYLVRNELKNTFILFLITRPLIRLCVFTT